MVTAEGNDFYPWSNRHGSSFSPTPANSVLGGEHVYSVCVSPTYAQSIYSLANVITDLHRMQEQEEAAARVTQMGDC